MKLSKLTLHGYKTFASRTVFEFNEGITAIVGPNGSGKSNIADAIRWVLGEQSYGTLRGKRTADMIFAGSQQRPRAGMAQAILTLDNSTGWIPLEYSEIEIGRRAYRSGENEYLLNGQKVRLRDVVELLASSGLVQHTYTIISQGLVDQALSLRADERRLLFEGAAGVSQYKLRRAETLRRLEETNHNLERLHDILTEIKPHLNSLRRQANRAKNYEQIAADLKFHLRIWYGFRWEDTSKQLLEFRDRSQTTQQHWEQGRHKHLALQQELDEFRRQIYTYQKELQEKEEERNSLRDRIALERQAVAVLEERRDSIKTQLDELEVEIPAIQIQHTGAQAETKSAILGLESAQVELDEKRAEIREFELNSLSAKDRIQKQQRKVSELGQAKGALLAQIAEASGQRALYLAQIDKLEGELAIDHRQDEAQAGVERLSKMEDAAKDDLFKIGQKLDKQRLIRISLEKTTKEFQDQYQLLESKHVGIRDEVLTLRTRLDELHKQRAQEPEITGDYDLVGKFTDLVFIPEAYRTPILAALVQKLATYATPNSKSFWELVRTADGLPLSVADLSHIIVPDDLQVPDHAGAIGWAESMVKTEDITRNLVKLLLGQVLIVHDAKTAYELAFQLPHGAMAVSLDGFVAYAGGLVEIGTVPAFSDELSWNENKTELQAKLDEHLGRLDDVQDELARLIVDQEESGSKLGTVNESITDIEQEERQAGFKIMEARRSRELAEQHLQFVMRSIEASLTELNLQREQLKKIDESIVNNESEVEKLESMHLESRQELQEMPVRETQMEQEQKLQRVEAAQTILAGRQAVLDSRRATLNQLDDQLRRREERRRELETRRQELNIDEHSYDLQKTLAILENIELSIDPLRNKLVEGRERLNIIEEELGRIQRNNHELENSYMQARIEFSQAENQLDALRDRIVADLGLVVLSNADDSPSQSPLPMAEVVEELPVVDSLPDDIEEIISRYRGQLTRMGPVNLSAPVEYKQTAERYEFLNQQVEDMATTKQRLEQVIDDLDHLTSTAFAETVKKVDREFGTVFQRLFGGGSAQLVLTDPDDLTLSGVDIVARLPRRREQGLALLSGGERSLTATALIFSLLKVSPTPFCVLDEVDAMLDEANVNRFRDLLDELSEKTQFILITHNRGTVQVAETVYGVSMGADSVSQVISIRPEDYLKDQDL